ncbi:hypothetical protein DITRI_Ditri06bG0128000 [Diplodiscus trichospermus]
MFFSPRSAPLSKGYGKPFWLRCRDDPFANVLLPVDYDPKGHYASELYLKKVLSKSHFLTKNPCEADLFFMPFSIVEMQHDPRIDPEGRQDFIKDYIYNISHSWIYSSQAYASMPQIWPRQGDPPNFASSKRKQLAFSAGTINSPARVALLKVWGNDTDIFCQLWPAENP